MLYRNGIQDRRTRCYLPAVRILAQQNAENTAAVIGNRELQTFLWDKNMPLCRIAPGGWLLIDFGTELHGGVRLLSLVAGKIRIRFGESVSEAMQLPVQDHAIHDAELQIPKQGMLEYGNTAFRFVRIDSLEKEETLVFHNILAVALYRELEWSGSFESDDERLNRIWKTGAYTVHLNIQDYIYDGVKRDRLPWMGDLNPELRTILSVFSDTSSIPETLDYLKEHTMSGSWMNNIVSYSLWFIISHWEYYMHSGNLDYLARQREHIDGLFERYYTMIAPDGSERLEGFRFLDWQNHGNAESIHAGLQGLFYWAVSCGRNIAQALQYDSSRYDHALSLLKKHIPDCGSSKAAAAILSVSGLADRSDVILRDPFRGVSTFLGCYMLDALPTVNALELIRRYWGAMLDYGATTFWEDFDLEWIKNASSIAELPVPGKDDLHGDFGRHCYKGFRHSLCHGWASGPTPFMSRRVLGVRFLEPGGGKILVAPELCGLKYVRGACPTPKGIIKIEAEPGGTPEISAPAGVEIITRPVRDMADSKRR